MYETIESNPEHFGLTLIASVDTAATYEFNTSLLLEREGRFFYAFDSGCSCPIPFEGIGVDDLISVASIAELGRLIDENHSNYHAIMADDRANFLAAAREAGLR